MRQTSRWLLLVLLVEAPALFGTTRPWTIEVFKTLLWLTVILWLAGCVGLRRPPVVPRWVVVVVAVLIAQGLFLAWNAHSSYDPALRRFSATGGLIAAAPGAVDRWTTLAELGRLVPLLGVIVFSGDLMRRPRWRRRVVCTMAVSGMLLILFGLVAPNFGWKLQSVATGMPGVTSFATYYYHSNAGAFINVILPLVAGLAVNAFRVPQFPVERALWVCGILLCLAGSAVAASKAGMVITVLLLLTIVVWQTAAWLRRRIHLSVQSAALAAAIVALCAVLAVTVRWDLTSGEWKAFPESFGLAGSGALIDPKSLSRLPLHARGIIPPAWENGRLIIYQICGAITPLSGAWGIGPGNFGIAYHMLAKQVGIRAKGGVAYAHNDYLQALIEWGWIGSALAACLLIGAFRTAVKSYRQRPTELTRADRTLLFSAALALAGLLLHAAVDFPLQIGSIQLYAAVLLGMLCGSGAWQSSRTGRAPREVGERALQPR